ncbi:MAG: M20/M25/M40 family metallo-hydrolase [Ignavibacteria bacterium]|nr:M20/M25/M40 family metallo-hydrolase [Ignavibacteria bacterium]
MKKHYSLKGLLFIPLLFLVFYGFSSWNNIKLNSLNPIDSLELYRNTEITKEEIYFHIKYLASDELEGRKAGTNGDKLARDYISSEFSKYGLEPAGDSSYIQTFSIKSSLKEGNNNKLIFYINNSSKNLSINSDFYPYSQSNNAKAEGEAVFVGYGIKSSKYNDYIDSKGNEIDVKNKIIIFFDDVPETKTVKFKGDYKLASLKRKINYAVNAGAIGIIIIYSKTNKEGKINFPKISDTDTENKEYNIPVVFANIKKINEVFNEYGIDIYKIQNKIIESQTPNPLYLNNMKITLQTEIINYPILTSNIIGYLKGSDPILNKEVVVIGAHYDHEGYGFNFWNYEDSGNEIHNGADDNASGTTGVLELAQKVSANKEKFKRSFLFICFGAEEMGLLGSSYFTNSNLFKKYNIVAMINLDMIGRLENNSLTINGTKTSDLWENLLDSINKSYNFKTIYIPDGIGGSDHTSFTLKRVPTLFFFTGIHSDYHKPTDDYWKINTKGEEKILNFVYDVITYIANTDKLINFNDVSFKKAEENEKKVKVEVYLGTIPDFSFDGKGVRLAGVKKDSPADKATLTEGDIIIKFGNMEIKDIYDYTKALSSFKPNDEVEIVIIRNETEMTIKATLGSK